MTPLLATTHDHCPVRGRVRTASGLKDTMSEVTKEWAPALAAAFRAARETTAASVLLPPAAAAASASGRKRKDLDSDSLLLPHHLF